MGYHSKTVNTMELKPLTWYPDSMNDPPGHLTCRQIHLARQVYILGYTVYG
jgi:hypothetical protein